MKIVCDSCGAKYSIADEKVAGKIFKIRCKKCSSVLEVRGDQTGAQPLEASLGQDQSAEAGWYIVVDGEQQGPLPPIQLSQLFAKGSAGLDSYVWKEGFDDWKVAGDVPELVQILGGAGSQRRSQTAPIATDDTSAIGSGGDLFGDSNGREPTGEVETHGNMFDGFDDSPAASGESHEAPLAAQAGSRAVAGEPFGGMGGAMGAATPQRMTGARNENSVLFSLGNLQQLASRGGSVAPAASASSTQPVGGGQTSGEGSGLIDIRALAKSTTPGTQAAPSQAVDDLLAIGTSGGGATLGAPLFGPAPVETNDRSRWLWIGVAAVAVIGIVGGGVWIGMVLGASDDDALEIAAVAEPTQGAEMPGSDDAAKAAPAPGEPPETALAAAAPAPEEPQEIVDVVEEPAEAPQIGEKPAPTKKTASSRQRRSSTQRRQRTAAENVSSEPAPKKRSGDSLDALMDEVVGGPSKSSSTKRTSTTSKSRSSDSGLPDAPSRNDVKTALQGVSGAVKGCRKDAGGTAVVNVTFSGKTGRATGARIASGPFKGTPVGACVERAVKRARVPRFKQSSFKVTFPYRL